jgi:uncharacterized protein with HEPN domain
MLDAAQQAISFTNGRSRVDLDTDQMLLFAIVRAIEIVGEAAGRVSPESREQCSGLPWASIVAMRNRLIHAYFNVDLDRVWETVTDDLPPLIAEIKVILGE